MGFSKFRCGMAPVRMETYRYRKGEVHKRAWFISTEYIEDEMHVILNCPLYTDFMLYVCLQKPKFYHNIICFTLCQMKKSLNVTWVMKMWFKMGQNMQIYSFLETK